MAKRSHPSWKGRFVMTPKAGARAQQVTVKARLVHRGQRGLRSLVASTALELRYMEKSDRGHESYGLYQGRDGAAGIDRQAFAAQTREDPYQWRLILSPARGQELDLTSLTRRTMAQMEQDTGYRLDWVAANHYDTGQPHTHILLRGRDLDGHDVGLTRDYLSHGLRYRVQDLVTQDLGLRELAPTREYTHGQARGLVLTRALDQVWDRPLIGHRLSGIYHTPEQASYGDVAPHHQERFWTERAALDAGYRRAENDHYGPGTGVARDFQASTLERAFGVPGRLPREAPVGGGLRARLDPEPDHDRGR